MPESHDKRFALRQEMGGMIPAFRVPATGEPDEPDIGCRKPAQSATRLIAFYDPLMQLHASLSRMF
jgi:hypothetical protein